MRHPLPLLACSLLGPALVSAQTRADTLHVPEEFPTIQDAIDVAFDGDEIVVADGVYTESGNTDLDFRGTTIVLRSESGDRAACVIDCGKNARFGTIRFDEVVSIRSLTIRNGHADSRGGAVATFVGADVSLIDLAFEACSAQDGGALFIGGSNVVIDGCHFSGNSSTDHGGAVRVEGEAVLTCIDSSFEGNTAGIHGGAIHLGEIDPASVIARCRFERNTATFSGGAVVALGAARLVDVVFLENEALGGGAVGDVHFVASSTEYTNVLFVGNRAIGNGAASGAVDLYGEGTARFVNCTFALNSSDSFGGAITVLGGREVEIVNSVLWGNDAPSGAEIHVGYPGEQGGAVLVSHCDVAGGEEGVVVCCDATLEWGDGNIDDDPLFDEHYGPTAGSPVVDAGDDTAVPKDIVDDINGRPRFVDGNGDATATVDMGACEYQTCPADIDRDGVVGFGDVLDVLAAWGPYAPCPPAVAEDLDLDCEIGFGDLLAVLTAWGPCE